MIGRVTFFSTVFAVLIAGSAVAGDLTIEPSVEVREAFSDNVDLATKDSEETAFISEVIPGIRVRSESARATGALDAFPIIRHQTAGDDAGRTFSPSFTGLGTVEVSKDLFFLDAQASVSQQVLESGQSASTSNERTVQVYRLSPYLRNRFGGFAEAEARYRLSQILFESQDGTSGSEVSDSTAHQLSALIQSGDDFSKFSWRLSSFASEEDRNEDDDVSRREADLELSYAIDRTIALIAAAGYQFFDDGERANKIDEPVWRAGFRWRPGPRTDLVATYGKRDADQSANVKFSYKIGPRTTVIAGYSKNLEKAQERLIRTLSKIDIDGETGNFIDQDTEIDFNPNPSPFSIDNRTVRIETFEVGLNGVRGRNTFGIRGSYQIEETEPSGAEENVIRASLRFSRRFSPNLTGNLFAGYERTEFDDGQKDDEYVVTGGLGYQVYSNLNAGFLYSFRLQDSSLETAEFLENRITVNVRITF